jgi:DNA-binding NarL/FixJ family response regulator
MEVVATPGDAASALMACRKQRPDVVLLDLKIPLGGGRRVLDELAGANGHRPVVVVLSAWDDDAARDEMLAGGAALYLVKGCPNGEILDAIRQAAGTGKPTPGRRERPDRSSGSRKVA